MAKDKTVKGEIIRLITKAACPICGEENYFDTGEQYGNFDDSDSETCIHFSNISWKTVKGLQVVTYEFDADKCECNDEDHACCDPLCGSGKCHCCDDDGVDDGANGYDESEGDNEDE